MFNCGKKIIYKIGQSSIAMLNSQRLAWNRRSSSPRDEATHGASPWTGWSCPYKSGPGSSLEWKKLKISMDSGGILMNFAGYIYIYYIVPFIRLEPRLWSYRCASQPMPISYSLKSRNMDSLYEAVQEWYNSAVFVSASQSGPPLPPRHRDLSLIDGFHRHAAPHIEKLWGGQKVTICPAETQHFGQGLRLGSLKLAVYSSNLMQSTGILRPKIWPDEFTRMWIYPRSKPDGTSENAWRSKKRIIQFSET